MLQKGLYTFLISSILLAGCSTKVELNTEWRDTSVIFGLLDQNDEYHYVKINKAFLGEGNSFTYAMIRDSSEYTNVNAYIEELSNGVVVNTYTLRDTALDNRDTTGVFYGPEQTLYYFKKTGLDPTHTYRFKAKINEGTSKEKEVTGETALVEDFSISNITTLSFGNYTSSGPTVTYPSPTVKFAPPDNAESFEILLRLKWDEYVGSAVTHKRYEWLVGTVDITSKGTDGLIPYELSGEAFYRTLDNIIANDATITKRVFRSVDVIVYAASEDLETYINVNKPQTGLVQERPQFTNISNGLGLFSSRLHVTISNIKIGLGSYRELMYGPHTGDLLFCSDTTSGPFVTAGVPTVICP